MKINFLLVFALTCCLSNQKADATSGGINNYDVSDLNVGKQLSQETVKMQENTMITDIQSSLKSLLSAKFSLIGNELDEEISKQIENLKKYDVDRIIEVINSNKDDKFSDSTVTLYIPKESKNKEKIIEALMAGAYFPKELDPLGRDFLNICDHKHIYEQLIKSQNCGRPKAVEALKLLLGIFCLSNENPIYEKLENVSTISVGNCNVIYFKLNKIDTIKNTVPSFDLNNQEEIESYFASLKFNM